MTPPDYSFYLVELAAYRMSGQETCASLFTVIVRPTAEAKDFGEQRKDLAERDILRMRFWTELLENAKKRGVMVHAQRAPSTDNWLSAGAGAQSGLSFVYLVWLKEESAVELYIDVGEEDQNRLIFDELRKQKEAVEAVFGAPLFWDALDGRRASRVRFTIREGGLLDQEKWPKIQDAMIAAMGKLSNALRPFLGRG